jgi:short-subunit dehydrogenase
MTYFAGKAVVITGASSGIGAWLAREAARRGARVGLLARREERLAQLAAEIEEAGGRAAWASADVVDAGELERGLDRLAEELEPPHKFKPGRALAMYDVNLFGMLRTVDWALPRFLDRRSGHLVGVASVASFLGMTNSASYCGSKAAMRVHLQSLRVSLAPYGVAVTTICPGFVESELTEKNKFRMPFIWETERAARKIADAIEKRRGEVVFPWQMKAFIGLATRVLPTALVERFMTPRKAKEPE